MFEEGRVARPDEKESPALPNVDPARSELFATLAAINGASSEGQRTRHGKHATDRGKIDTATGAKVAAVGPMGYHIPTTRLDARGSRSTARSPIRGARTIDPSVRWVISHALSGLANAPCAIRTEQTLVGHTRSRIRTSPGPIETATRLLGHGASPINYSLGLVPSFGSCLGSWCAIVASWRTIVASWRTIVASWRTLVGNEPGALTRRRMFRDQPPHHRVLRESVR
jgi:hypothetical protein